MKLDPKKKFICPVTRLTVDIEHCKSYGNGSSVPGIKNGCKYFKKDECCYEDQ